jgi:2'-hydroxyisoflavone reductase
VDVLVLGGTRFVGRAIVAEALRHGMDVTLFTRGRTNPGLFPGVPRLTGDRDTGDYTALRGRTWDAVVDVTAFVPRHVAQATAALTAGPGRTAPHRYLLISSHAVYDDTRVTPGHDEDAPRREPVRDTEELDQETYGRLKVACEDDALALWGERATIVRPGKVAGPHDASDTFTYWTRRASRGGRIALPGDPEQPVQVVDARDLAALVVRLIADDRAGAFHAVGPEQPVTLRTLIETCAQAAGAADAVEIVPVDVPAAELPPLFPLIRPNRASQQRGTARARAAGMPATPLAVTAADVLAWDRDRGLPPLTKGWTPEQEAAVLAAYAPN